MSARAESIDLDPALGGWRLIGLGRVPGSSWRGAHIYLVHREALAARDAARASATELAADALPLGSAAALPAPPPWRGDPALDAMTDASGRLAGAVGTGVLAVPAPQAPVGAVPRAERAATAGHASTGGAGDWTRPAARTTGRD